VIHLTIQQLSSYLDGQLTDASADHAREHLAECEECASKYAALEEQEALLTGTLTHDPGEPFFEAFASEVETRITSRGSSTPEALAPKLPASRGGTPEVTSKKRPLAMSVPPARRMGAPDVLTASASRPSGRSLSWFAAVLLVMIVGSVGVLVANSGRIVSRIDLLADQTIDNGNRAFGPDVSATPTSPLPSSDEPAPYDVANGTPLRSPGPAQAGPMTRASQQQARARASRQDWKTDDEAAIDPGSAGQPVTESGSSMARALGSMPAPEGSEPVEDPAAAASPPDPFASLPSDELPAVRTAQQVSERARSEPSANNYEAAAAAWELALDEMRGRPEQTVARQRAAEARFYAWQASPNSDRADAAMRALRTYLVAAPPGLAREEAKFRLAQLNR